MRAGEDGERLEAFTATRARLTLVIEDAGGGVTTYTFAPADVSQPETFLLAVTEVNPLVALVEALSGNPRTVGDRLLHLHLDGCLLLPGEDGHYVNITHAPPPDTAEREGGQ